MKNIIQQIHCLAEKQVRMKSWKKKNLEIL